MPLSATNSETDLPLAIIDAAYDVEVLARDLYAIFAMKSPDPELRNFWLDFSKDEGSHLDFWDNLREISKSLPITAAVEHPDALLASLDKAKYMASQMIRDVSNSDDKALKRIDTLLMAYRLELHMLDSTFQTLFQSLRFLQNDFDPVIEYDSHLAKFTNALIKFGSGYSELELLAETLNQLWTENKRLAGLALKDSLTGVLNRRGFVTLGGQICALMRRTGSVMGLIMIDLDSFKQLNDTRGHSVGDMALVTTARTLSGHLRKSDIIGRYGGDEFVILLPDTSNTETVCSKMLKVLNHELDVAYSISATAGFVQEKVNRSDLPDCLESLMKKADARLYENKRNGI